jgi:hypothetical protein
VSIYENYIVDAFPMLCQELWKRWTGAVHLPSLGLLSAYMSLKKTNEENDPLFVGCFMSKR